MSRVCLLIVSGSRFFCPSADYGASICLGPYIQLTDSKHIGPLCPKHDTLAVAPTENSESRCIGVAGRRGEDSVKSVP